MPRPGLLAEHLLVVDRAVERHNGRRIGDVLQGDATMSVFHRASDAVHAGVDLQRALAGGRVQVHCGVHTGEAVAVDDSFAGATLSRVAHVRALAEAGQVILSATTARLASADLPSDVGLVELGPHRLDGFDEPETIFAVDAPGLAVPPDPQPPPYRGLVPYDVDDDEAFFGRDNARSTSVCRGSPTHHFWRSWVRPAVANPPWSEPGWPAGSRRRGTAGRRAHSRPGSARRLGRRPRDGGADDRGDRRSARRALRAGCSRPEAAHQFLDDLVERLEVGPVVVTLRADHVGSVTAHPNFARRLETGLHLVTPMTAAELREVIEDVRPGTPDCVSNPAWSSCCCAMSAANRAAPPVVVRAGRDIVRSRRSGPHRRRLLALAGSARRSRHPPSGCTRGSHPTNGSWPRPSSCAW